MTSSASIAALLAIGVFAAPALAAPGCRGSMSASSLQPMAPGTPIMLEVINQTAVNMSLGGRFAAGMQAGGAKVAADSTLHLRLVFLLRNSATNGVYGDFSWLDNPAGGDNPLTGNGPRPAITLTATLTDMADSSMVWVASVDCVIETNTMDALAYDLGTVIGRAVGKNLPQGKL